MAFSVFSNKKAIRQAKEAAGQQQYAAAWGMEATDAAQARVLAGEAAKANIFNALGQEGTYEPGSGTGKYGTGQTNLFDPNSMPNPSLKEMGTHSHEVRKHLINTPREGVIDPEGYANATIGTIPFKMRSKMTAQAYQLLNKKGPEWDMLENATLGQVYEGAALQLRDTVRRLKNDYAKGGSARRAALNEVNMIRVEEEAYRTRVNQTWQANLALHQYTQTNAERVQAGNIEYVESLPGLNNAYRQSMTATAELMGNMAKTGGNIAGKAYTTKASEKAKNFGGKLLEATIQAAASSGLDALKTVLGGGSAITEAGGFSGILGDMGTTFAGGLAGSGLLGG